MPAKNPKSSSDSTASTGAPGYSLKDAGDFIERVKALGAIAVVVGDISVRFPDVLQARKRPEAMTMTEIQEHSA